MEELEVNGPGLQMSSEQDVRWVSDDSRPPDIGVVVVQQVER